ALVQAGGDVALLVDALDLDPGVGEDALVLRADDGSDRAMGLFGGHGNRICGRPGLCADRNIAAYYGLWGNEAGIILAANRHAVSRQTGQQGAAANGGSR